MTARGSGGNHRETPDLLTTDEAAAYLTLTPASLKAWRVRGGGPPWLKLGQLVRYSRSDLDAWLNAQRVTS